MTAGVGRRATRSRGERRAVPVGPAAGGGKHSTHPSDTVIAVPKTLYSLWMQGLDAAPELVRQCLARWSVLNPHYELRVLDAADVEVLLADLTVPASSLTPQALSDLTRARTLLTKGGVWVDASVFPVRPLAGWLPKYVEKTGFFAFDKPAPDRPLSSWFLASSANHPLLQRWWEEIDRFWCKPRILAKYLGEGRLDGEQIPRDPIGAVAPDAGGATAEYPYFWFHYLFSYLLERDGDFADRWRRCTKRSATPAHRLLWLFAGGGRPEPSAVLDVLSASPVHKLDWRASYPFATFEALCRTMSSPRAAAGADRRED